MLAQVLGQVLLERNGLSPREHLSELVMSVINLVTKTMKLPTAMANKNV